MFKRVLIANRGEIAIRVARTLREMGISPVTIYSEPDAFAPHVKACDAAICVGGALAKESYLLIDRVIDAAFKLGAQAIHPGYGFLSENEDFAQAVTDAGLTLIGPSAHAMTVMGSKTDARTAMQKAGVPIVPGTTEPVDGTDEELVSLALTIGLPVMIKAVAGGGGKGMRLVHDSTALPAAIRGAKSEAQSAFGDGRIYIERYIQNPRHIEIQIMTDKHGHGVFFGERDCSMQRRHQKVIEEAPSPKVDACTRQKMGEIAVKGALSVGYHGAGTMEFLLDNEGHFYFLEMNTRLQVEHPVTEMIYGVDLVREQVRVAAGEALVYTQADLVPRGHAIEARVYAEDPAQKFMPCPGKIDALFFPAGPFVRVDSGVEAGFSVPIFYDPMIAKIIAYGATRAQAVARLDRALSETKIAGIKTNVSFLRTLLNSDAFQRNHFDTGYIDRHLTELLETPCVGALDETQLVIGAALHRYLNDIQHASQKDQPSLQRRESLWLQWARQPRTGI